MAASSTTWTKDTRPISPGRPPSLRTEIEKKFGKNGSDAWDVLESIMHGRLESTQEHVLSDGRIVEYVKRPTISERKDAAVIVLQYLEGKPRQQTEINVNVDAPKLNELELKTRVAEILARYATAPTLDAPSERERALIPASVDDAADRERGE